MIDIIIPAYNSHNTLEQTLFSIAYQDNIEKCNIYIINDCSDSDYGSIVNFFRKFINIIELKLEVNSGPGVARQYGIDHSNSEYILFIDSDDVFSSCLAISSLYNEIKNKNSDIVISNFVEETDDSFFDHVNDTIWLHGKIYKRKFLEDKKIRFNDSRYNEDNGFNQLILLHNPKINFLPIKTYIWRNNKNSITRKNNYNYKISGLEGYVYNINYALESGIKNNCPYNNIAELAFQSLVAMYCYYLEYKTQINNIGNIINITRNIKRISEMYKLDDNLKLDILESQLKYLLNNDNRKYLLNPFISFDSFLSNIIG